MNSTFNIEASFNNMYLVCSDRVEVGDKGEVQNKQPEEDHMNQR